MSIIRSFALVSVSVALLACSSEASNTGTQAASVNNYEGCKKYIKAVNDLECMKGAAALNEEQQCQAYKNATTCDFATYFDCLGKGYVCKDMNGVKVVDATETQKCSVPTCK
jgi:hypothetical protein